MQEPPHVRAGARTWAGLRRNAPAAFVAALIIGNAAVITWLWLHGGYVTKVHTTGELFTSIARLTGVQSAYLALIQVVLLARLPALERAFGFDRLSRWHRWNGHLCIDLVIAHVVFSVWGYALMDRFPLGREISTMIWGGVYPGMITATIVVLVVFRVLVPLAGAVRYRLRVAEVTPEGPGVVSLRIAGRNLDRLRAPASPSRSEKKIPPGR